MNITQTESMSGNKVVCLRKPAVDLADVTMYCDVLPETRASVMFITIHIISLGDSSLPNASVIRLMAFNVSFFGELHY